MPGARALLLADDLPTGPTEAFLVGREFSHGHAQSDHSLHLAPPTALAIAAEQLGWVEPHFLARTGRLPSTVVMLYGPRSEEEAQVAVDLVRASHHFASGAPAPTHRQESALA